MRGPSLTKKATDPPLPILVRSDLPPPVSDLVMAAMLATGRLAAGHGALEYELNKYPSGCGAAMAQILGMTTDAHVVATLNPGCRCAHSTTQ